MKQRGRQHQRFSFVIGCLLLFSPFTITIVAAWTLSSSSSNSRSSYFFQSPTALPLAPQQLGVFETLSPSQHPSQRQVRLINLLDQGPVDFASAWDLQKQLLQQHTARLDSKDGSTKDSFIISSANHLQHSLPSPGVDTVLLLEHQPVYTLGTASDESFILRRDPNIPVVRMDRGGEVTYHGPGQLVVYPVLDLRHYRPDIHWYMRALEECVLIALKNAGLQQASRQVDATGVWIDNYKLAAMGVKCRRWITQHGLAVNVEVSALTNFENIVPCGLEGRRVGCMNQFLQNDTMTTAEFAEYMKRALEEVFQIRFVQ